MHHTADNALGCHKELQQYKTCFQSHSEASLMVTVYSEMFLCHLHCNKNWQCQFKFSYLLITGQNAYVAANSPFHNDGTDSWVI